MVAAHRGGIQQDIDQVVGQQVDLVDVEDSAVCGGQQTGLEGADAFGQCLFQVEGSDYPVLGGTHRQLDQPGGMRARHRVGMWAVRAARFDRVRGASEAASAHYRHLGQQGSKAAYGRRLGGSLLAADQYAADHRGYSVQDEGQLHGVRTDDRGERKALAGARDTGGLATIEHSRGHVRSSRSPSLVRYTSRNRSSVSCSGLAHMPRSAASRRRSVIPRSAHGLDFSMNSRTSWSKTYDLASCSYIQSWTTPAVASYPNR